MTASRSHCFNGAGWRCLFVQPVQRARQGPGIPARGGSVFFLPLALACFRRCWDVLHTVRFSVVLCKSATGGRIVEKALWCFNICEEKQLGSATSFNILLCTSQSAENHLVHRPAQGGIHDETLFSYLFILKCTREDQPRVFNTSPCVSQPTVNRRGFGAGGRAE